jgi:hypothetical protein
MEFAEKLSALAAKVRQQRGVIQTEEATKNAFVMPNLLRGSTLTAPRNTSGCSPTKRKPGFPLAHWKRSTSTPRPFARASKATCDRRAVPEFCMPA